MKNILRATKQKNTKNIKKYTNWAQLRHGIAKERMSPEQECTSFSKIIFVKAAIFGSRNEQFLQEIITENYTMVMKEDETILKTEIKPNMKCVLMSGSKNPKS